MTDDLFNHFDAWEPLLKARKAKGLDKWDRLKNISAKLQGKDVKAIAFTCAHPSHANEPTRHLLGSVEGNLHFLLGYGNPSFHLAPYHWQVIDPNVTDEEAEEMSSRMSHPSNPVLWGKVGLDVGDEGDLDEGQPHELHKQAKKKEKKDSARAKEGIRVRSAAGTYIAYPSEGFILGEHNSHIYSWDMVKDSFFTSQHPEVAEAMENASMLKSVGSLKFKESIPTPIKLAAAQYKGSSYDPDVWELVKSRMPVPGKVLRLAASSGETVYGLTTPTSLQFYTRGGEPASIKLHDREYLHFDLVKSGNVPPASLLDFIVQNFKVNVGLLKSVIGAKQATTKAAVTSVLGIPSPGWDEISSDYTEELVKSVVRDGDIVRVHV